MGGKLCRYGWCIRSQNTEKCKENHSTAKKGHRRNLSAAFNVAGLIRDDTDGPTEEGLININFASEEELMTLPGVNRQTAHNIVEYRRKLGGFKKIEDIALVSGVGATKLNHIRLEITTGRIRSTKSCASYGEYDSISRSSSRNAPQIQLRVNVNTSNVFQLMKVNGISQTLAENIVAYRDRKGLFQRLDDLCKVKGMRGAVLSAVRPYLYINGDSESGYGSPVKGDIQSQCSQVDSIESIEHVEKITESQEDFLSLYGPLSRKSWRGKKKPTVVERTLIRLASWNLDKCSEMKADNPGVREVIAMTILENSWSVVAFQEILDCEALIKLCEELNQPTVPTVRKFQNRHSHWKTVLSPQQSGTLADGRPTYLGFLYDSSCGIHITDLALLDRCKHQDEALKDKLLLVAIKIENQEFILVNGRFDVQTADERTLDNALSAIEAFEPGRDNVIFLGSFNADSSHKAFDAFKEQFYSPLLIPDKYTNISTKNPEGTRCQDNIWIGASLKPLFTGTSEVVRDALTSPWIPDEWGWGGVVSTHCPIYAEFQARVSDSRNSREVVKRSNSNGLAALKMIPMMADS